MDMAQWHDRTLDRTDTHLPLPWQANDRPLPDRKLPAPVVETHRCAAYRCKELRTHAWDVYGLSSVWCTEHTRQIKYEGKVPPVTWWQQRKLRRASR